MKKMYLLVLCINILLAACSTDDGNVDNPKEPIENTAPSIPVQIYPSKDLVCIENTIDFQWEPSNDEEENVIRYEVEIATDNIFSEDLQSASTLDVHKTLTLDRGQMYYWRMKATDTKDASSDYSEVFNFYTEGDGVVNYLPFAPDLVSPELNSLQPGGSIELRWTATDADENDVLEYDVYFGQSNPPSEKIATAININSVTVDDVTTNGDYFWKVVARDDQGGTTVGQIWKFTVE